MATENCSKMKMSCYLKKNYYLKMKMSYYLMKMKMNYYLKKMKNKTTKNCLIQD